MKYSRLEQWADREVRALRRKLSPEVARHADGIPVVCFPAPTREMIEEEGIEPDLLGPNGLYELTKEGVTWYYQPYDIAPYYLGVISITVPWKELKPYIR